MSQLFHTDLNIYLDDIPVSEPKYLGVSSTLPAYRFCWQLNHIFEFQLSTAADFTILSNGLDYIYYLFSDEPMFRSLKVIVVKNGEGILTPELKSLDYLLMFYDNWEEEELSDIRNKIRNFEGVLLVNEVAAEKLSKIRKLIL